MKEHKKCPKEDCNWDKAKEEKEKLRHVWTIHGDWAEKNGLPSIGGYCSECDRKFRRRDHATRHMAEVHGQKKRTRKAGG